MRFFSRPSFAASAIVLFSALFASSQAQARHGGLYVDLEPGWGFFLSHEVITNNGDDSGSNFPDATFLPQLKLGVNLFGWAGVEANVAGHWWKVGTDPGGAGYVGGVFRLTPLEALSYVMPDDVKLPSIVPSGPVTWKDRPFDLGLSIGGGYTLAGEDYAYQGSYLQYGFDLRWFITPNFAVGFDLPVRQMFYQPFRYTNLSKNEGYCTDGAQAFGKNGQKQFVDPTRNPAIELTSNDIASNCTKAAPQATLIAPSIFVSGVFDFGI